MPIVGQTCTQQDQGSSASDHHAVNRPVLAYLRVMMLTKSTPPSPTFRVSHTQAIVKMACSVPSVSVEDCAIQKLNVYWS